MDRKHEFDIEGWNRTADEAVEAHKKLSPQMAEKHRKFLESLEEFLESKGVSVPKHSHRFLPENLWPKSEQDGSSNPKTCLQEN